MATIAAQLNDLSLKQTPLTKDFFDVTAGFAVDKPFDFAKVIEKSMEWVNYFDCIPEGQEATFTDIHFAAKMTKLSKWPGKLVSAVNKFRHALVDLYEKPSTHTLTHTFRKSLAISGPLWDGVDFLSRAIIYWPKEAFINLRRVNGVALAVGMGWSALENGALIASSSLYRAESEREVKVEQEKVITAFLSLAREVSYVALGILIALAAWFNIVLPAVAFCTASTLTVAFTALKYYYVNLGKEIPLKA